jgi:hypothetical protein
MLPAVNHQRVPCVVSALEPDDEVRLVCKQIYDLALSLIAPLSAYYDYVRHIFSFPQARNCHPMRAHEYPLNISN